MTTRSLPLVTTRIKASKLQVHQVPTSFEFPNFRIQSSIFNYFSLLQNL